MTGETGKRIRIATRTSALALWQANYMADLLRTLPGVLSVELVHVVTTGDQNQTDALRQFGGTGVFTREVQKAVLDGRADLAVHSLKDLPTTSADGLQLGCVPVRAPRFDSLLLPHGRILSSIQELPSGARIGTGSPRRQAQLRHHRPDLQLLEIRGNVDTRLRKLDEGQFDAILLAEAGLRRLELANRISILLTPPLFLPAVGQGALGIECRSDDADVQMILAQLNCPHTLAEVTAERALLRELRAGCHAPLGAWARLGSGSHHSDMTVPATAPALMSAPLDSCPQNASAGTGAVAAGAVAAEDTLTLTGVLLSHDGVRRIEKSASGPVSEAESIGRRVAQALFCDGGDCLLTETQAD